MHAITLLGRYALAVGLAMLWPAAGASGAPDDAPHIPPGSGLTYRLADTWSDAPWAPAAGRYRRVRDISSAPDGTIYVVDSRDIGFLHVLAPDGTPVRLIAADDIVGGAGDDWLPCRVDVGFDGQVYVLSNRESCAAQDTRVDRLAPNGAWMDEVAAGDESSSYTDLAVQADGRLYLTRFGATGGVGSGLGQVDVRSRNGNLIDTISPRELGLPVAVDVARDGTVYVVSRIDSFDTAPPPPGPEPTAEPSLSGPQLSEPLLSEPSRSGQPSDRPEQAGAPVEGVLVFEPNHRLRATFPFVVADDVDVAVGPAGVFVSRGVEIFRLGVRDPVYAGPTGFYGSIALDVPVDGRLLGGFNHCYFRGLLTIADPAESPVVARLQGAQDRPDLEGPVYPVRIAASAQVAVLQGGFDFWGEQPDRAYSTAYYADQPQAVQRWTRAGLPIPDMPDPTAGPGRLESQLGLCAFGDSLATRDVAVDGSDVYTINAYNTLLYRPDNLPPAWSAALDVAVDVDAPMHAVALAADDGRITVLDAAGRRVVHVDRDGTVVDVWPVGSDVNGVPVDIALDAGAGRVYLADQGAARILVRGLDGADLGAWPTIDGPARLAVGPGGDVFVLGRGGWGYRYGPDGALAAAWPLPRDDVDALDIAVDVDGHVYVSFLRRADHDVPATWLSFGGFDIVDAGVWVFAPDRGAGGSRPAQGCAVRGDKRAAPARVVLGDTVAVALDVDGRCPGQYDPVQLVVVVDTSGSMSQDGALDRAKAALVTLLGEIDPRAAEVALVTFGDAATAEAPFSRGIGGIAARVAALAAVGDSRLAPAIGVAAAMLSGPGRNSDARPVILLATDGVFKDAPEAAIGAARAAGIDLFALVFDNRELQDLGDEPLIDLEQMAGGSDHVLFEPERGALVRFGRAITQYRDEAGLFDTIAIDDIIPANMDYVPDSAAPPAAFDAARRALVWTFRDVPAADGLRLTYRLRPRQVGRWPTNISATGAYRDYRFERGVIDFPVPEVEVVARPIFLPITARHACLRPGRPLDAVLVMDTSTSMNDPVPGGGRTKLAAAAAAASAFLDLASPDSDRVAIVAFNHAASVVLGLADDPDAESVRAALARLAVDSGTRIDLGLRAAAEMIASDGRAEAQAAVILLTDGLQSTGEAPNAVVEAEAARLKAGGAWVHAIGLGDAIDRPLLAAIASGPDRYHESPTAADLEAIYRSISERLACAGG